MGWRVSKAGSVCKGCTERFEACHDVCSAFLQAKEEERQRDELIKKNGASDHLYDVYHYKKITSQRYRKQKNEKR